MLASSCLLGSLAKGRRKEDNVEKCFSWWYRHSNMLARPIPETEFTWGPNPRKCGSFIHIPFKCYGGSDVLLTTVLLNTYGSAFQHQLDAL
jgi:hypothetical protein